MSVQWILCKRFVLLVDEFLEVPNYDSSKLETTDFPLCVEQVLKERIPRYITQELGEEVLILFFNVKISEYSYINVVIEYTSII